MRLKTGPGSSYRATCGVVVWPGWLSTDWLLSAFAKTQKKAVELYKKFVAQGKNQPSPWESLKNPILLGDDKFVEKMQRKYVLNRELSEIPKVQKRKVPKPLDYYSKKHRERNTDIIEAYKSGGYSMKEVGDYFGVHYSSVSKIIKQADDSQFKT